MIIFYFKTLACMIHTILPKILSSHSAHGHQLGQQYKIHNIVTPCRKTTYLHGFQEGTNPPGGVKNADFRPLNRRINIRICGPDHPRNADFGASPDPPTLARTPVKDPESPGDSRHVKRRGALAGPAVWRRQDGFVWKSNVLWQVPAGHPERRSAYGYHVCMPLREAIPGS